MNMDRLVYFVTIAECHSFTVAARKCFISQTAISQQMAALEETFGVQLFARSYSGVELTEAGAHLLPYAQATLDAYQAMMDAMKARYGKTTALTVAYTGPLEQQLLHRAIPGFCAEHADVEIHFRQYRMSQLNDALRQGACDIALSIPSEIRYSGCHSVTVLQRPTMVAVSTASPLAQKPLLTLADIRAFPIVILQPDATLTAADRIHQWLLSLSFTEEHILRADTIEDQLLMVAANQGLSFMPQGLISAGIRLIPLQEDILAPHRMVACFKRNDGVTLAFVRHLQSAGESLL